MTQPNTQKFLDLFTRLEALARRAAGHDAGSAFIGNIDKARQKSRIFRANYDDLKMYARLRNVLVHERHESRYLAEPIPELVEHLARLISQIENPPRVLEHFRREVDEFTPDDCMVDVLGFLAQQNFSQTFVRIDGELHILTAGTIQRWLGHNATEELVDCTVSLGEVLKYKERLCEVMFFRRDATLIDALDAFDSEKNPRLAAIVITESGHSSQVPLALLTPSDLADVTRILEGA